MSDISLDASYSQTRCVSVAFSSVRRYTTDRHPVDHAVSRNPSVRHYSTVGESLIQPYLFALSV